MTAKEILKILKNDGWTEIPNRTKGSHLQLKHPTKPGKVTIPIHSGNIPAIEQHFETIRAEIGL